ncbi:MAG: sulfite exporter TauE/SafE family protein [Lachnospiraceae bacterium]|nr:sulfite exporter TauE/SafE family protein [Lachnospiraceae bacterium]
MHFMFFLVSFLASAAGAICGIGGGVIMKPLLDAAGILSVSAVSFLSGCTVLSMAAVSVGSSIKSKKNTVRFAVTAPLSIGAALGGLAGRITFQSIRNMALAENRVGFIQAEMLLAITLITFIYTLKKDKLQTLRLQNAAICVIVGIMLGFFSAFLGIGGGPVNLMVLSYFFSMDTKEAAVNSLFVILVSQIFNLMQTILSGNVPKLDAVFFVLMIAGGILGGKAGNRIYKKIRTEYINDLFQGLMIIIMLICMYNMYRFY